MVPSATKYTKVNKYYPRYIPPIPLNKKNRPNFDFPNHKLRGLFRETYDKN